MDTKVFSSGDGPNARDDFIQWHTDHPEAFYINLTTASQGMLHQVGCAHLGDPRNWDPGAGDVTAHAKACHKDIAALIGWARREGVNLKHCATCRP